MLLPTVSGGGVLFAAPDCMDEALSLAEGNNIYRCVMGW
jgi:hypothetical protein